MSEELLGLIAVVGIPLAFFIGYGRGQVAAERDRKANEAWKRDFDARHPKRDGSR